MNYIVSSKHLFCFCVKDLERHKNNLIDWLDSENGLLQTNYNLYISFHEDHRNFYKEENTDYKSFWTIDRDKKIFYCCDKCNPSHKMVKSKFYYDRWKVESKKWYIGVNGWTERVF